MPRLHRRPRDCGRPVDRHSTVHTLLPVLVVATLTLMLGGCDVEGDAGRMESPLRIGVLPDESPETIRDRYQVVLSYLEEAIGVPCELRVPGSYEELLSSFLRGEVDLAYFGGYTFVAARDRAGAVPLVLRAEDLQFVTYYLVPAGSTAESVDDLAGTRLAFGSELSTSGHLMPRHFLQQQGITPEQYFREVRYTGSHDATAQAVRDGEVDLGVANSLVIETMFRDGRLAAGDVRVLDESPPYVDYVWATRPEVPAALRSAVLDAFLALDHEREDHREILASLGARAFYPVGPGEFEDIESIARQMDMLECLE